VGERNLLSAIGLNSTVLNMAALVAPLAAGQLISQFGAGGLMLACSVSYLIVALGLLPIGHYRPLREVARSGVLRSLADGVQYIRQDPVVRWLLIVFGCATVLARPYLDLLPAVARDTLHVGPVELSWMVSAAGAGGLIGGFGVASLGPARRKGLIVLMSSLLAGAALAVASLQREIAPAVVLLGLTGFAMMLSAGMVGTVLQISTPDHLRGRVISVQSLLVDGGLSSGALLLGSLGSAIGISNALTVGGLLLVLATGVVIIRAPALSSQGGQRLSPVPNTTVV
jgi:predicted MFS family arabinose efflux permease